MQRPNIHKHGCSTRRMFVVMADITLREGCDEKFQEWFAESNRILSGIAGFRSRRLFRMHGAASSYRIVFEHESRSTFAAMHNSPEHEQVYLQGRPLMASDPARQTFEHVPV